MDGGHSGGLEMEVTQRGPEAEPYDSDSVPRSKYWGTCPRPIAINALGCLSANHFSGPDSAIGRLCVCVNGRDAIGLAVLEMLEKGELQKLHNTWWYGKGECVTDDSKVYTSLTEVDRPDDSYFVRSKHVYSTYLDFGAF